MPRGLKKLYWVRFIPDDTFNLLIMHCEVSLETDGTLFSGYIIYLPLNIYSARIQFIPDVT